MLAPTWGVLAFAIFLTVRPVPRWVVVTGALLGTVAGVLQTRALEEKGAELVSVDSLLGIRRVMMSSTPGRWSIYWIYAVKTALLTEVIVLYRDHILRACTAYIGGYLVFMCVRDLIAIRGVLRLESLSANADIHG